MKREKIIDVCIYILVRVVVGVLLLGILYASKAYSQTPTDTLSNHSAYENPDSLYHRSFHISWNDDCECKKRVTIYKKRNEYPFYVKINCKTMNKTFFYVDYDRDYKTDVMYIIDNKTKTQETYYRYEAELKKYNNDLYYDFELGDMALELLEGYIELKNYKKR